MKSVLQSEEEKEDQGKEETVTVTSRITGILGKHAADQHGNQSVALTAKMNMLFNEVSIRLCQCVFSVVWLYTNYTWLLYLLMILSSIYCPHFNLDLFLTLNDMSHMVTVLTFKQINTI